jgi:colicin import membrane protein
LSTFTLPSGRDHHFKERAFKGSFFVSIGIHVVILVAAGSMTLFRMSGTTYSPSYSVDLVSLPSPKPAKVAKPAPAEVKTQPTPTVEKKVPKPAESSPPEKILEKLKPSGGDEAARLERRQKIEDLEMEALRLYESYTTEEDVSTGESAQPAETDVDAPAVTSTPTGGNAAPSNIRFRAYYDRIWAKIRSSWILPKGVTSQDSLVTVVGIRIGVNGEIEQSWIEESSGNEYYDQSALRAIRKANPLPSLPDDISDTSLEVGINFRPPE